MGVRPDRTGAVVAQSSHPTSRRPGRESAVPESQEERVDTSPGGSAPQTPAEAVPGSGSGHQDRRLAPVAVALDAPDIDVAAHWATAVSPYVSTVKIGLELYLRHGPAGVATGRGGAGGHVFLDL